MNKMETFGMWHRPFEKSIDEVKTTLRQLKDMGITDIFLESFFNGHLIFPCKRSLFTIHDFIGNYEQYGKNLLLCFVEESKKLQIKIHAWVENFFIGVYKKKSEIPLFQQHPEYFLRTIDGDIFQKTEKNYVFLDPTNPYIQQHILKIYKAMSEFDISSLHLDYIRYPLSYHQTINDLSDDNGYSLHALKKFALQMHIDVEFIKDRIVTDPHVLSCWQKFKIETINDWVDQIKNTLNPIKLSTAVFGDVEHAMNFKMQNWEYWIKQQWVDLIIPMAYYKDPNRIFEELKKMSCFNIEILAGLAPLYMGLNIKEEFMSVQAALKANVNGVVLFASQKYLDRNFAGIYNHSKIRDAWTSFKRERI